MSRVDKWMSEFYGKKWVILESAEAEFIKKREVFYELRVDASRHEELQKAFDLGFELVETAVEFETEIYSDTSDVPFYIRGSEPGDLDDILELIDTCFVRNNDFYNRLKNKRFFSAVQCEDYYRQSIINNFSTPESLTTVAVKDEKVIGFYLIRRIGSEKYKVISTAVHPAMRGNKIHIHLQRKFTDILKKPFILVNRTQLGNYPVLKNHIKEKRNLSKIEHILYLERQIDNI